VKRLDEYWVTASRYVVHFSLVRVPEDVKDLQAFALGGAALKAMARDALGLFSQFLIQLTAVTPEWCGEARVPNRVTQPDEYNARLLFERTSRMRRDFVLACLEVGLDGESLLDAQP
jgi:hypothetical protein